ncbi:hypothetical protein P3102_13265 [Amycolatopsis sp. QT-25]|uniref:hypothetical protein n=1 Tax=Amycolatopsis sp. QT-25 TaxID=3034022 RepID=UPI0023EB5D13|nr:hypothetical protein [Amycolatopsis sp. QT-25]WET82096.1 hypothetical protein P3102_13265 [Amycolatopsis sp. QT-25]
MSVSEYPAHGHSRVGVPDALASRMSMAEHHEYLSRRSMLKVTETVFSSRVRYTGYSFLAIDVEPAWPGCRIALTVRTLRNDGVEIDRFTLRRTACLHRSRQASALSAVIPETLDV